MKRHFDTAICPHCGTENLVRENGRYVCNGCEGLFDVDWFPSRPTKKAHKPTKPSRSKPRPSQLSSGTLKPLSPSEAVAKWVVEQFVPPGTKPRKPRKNTKRRHMMKANIDEDVWPDLDCLCRQFAGYNLVRLKPDGLSNCTETSYEMDVLDIINEQMDAEDCLAEIRASSTQPEGFYRFLLSFSEPVFSKGGIVVVGINVSHYIPGFVSSLFSSLFDNSPDEQSSRTVAWIGLYCDNNEIRVFDPKRDTESCSLGVWLMNNDWSFRNLGSGMVVVFGVGRPKRKTKNMKIAED